MALTTEKVRRLVHYYELNFTFRDDFLPADGDQFRELFSIVITLAKGKAAIRYQTFGDKAIFIQDVKINPTEKQVIGKLRCIRKDILPEIMNTVTDEARGIDAKEEEGLLETTHFIIDFSKKKKKLALEFNQFGAKIVDFVAYLQNIGVGKKALKSVGFVPLVKDELKDLKTRINRTSEFIVKVHKDNVAYIQSIDKGLYTALEASIDHFKSEQATVILKFDYRDRVNTKEINGTIDKIINVLIKDKSKTEIFNTLEVKAENSEKNNKLETFDLLVDKVKHEILVEKKKRYRTVVSEDMFPKMKEKLYSLK